MLYLRTCERRAAAREKDGTAPQSFIGQGPGSAVMSRPSLLDSLVRQVPSSRLVTAPAQKLKRPRLRPDQHNPSLPSVNEARSRLPHFFLADASLFHYSPSYPLPCVALLPTLCRRRLIPPSALTASSSPSNALHHDPAMATQQVLIAETVAAMKKALKRKAYGMLPIPPLSQCLAVCR